MNILMKIGIERWKKDLNLFLETANLVDEVTHTMCGQMIVPQRWLYGGSVAALTE